MGKRYILSMDGGGIRGAATARFLELLEEGLGCSLYNKFDIFAGTSTGALLALLIAVNKASGRECVNLYAPSNARRMMNKSLWDRYLPVQNVPKYDGKGKRGLLKSIFAEKRLSDAGKKVLVTAYDIQKRKVHIFKNTRKKEGMADPLIVDIADATSAAPTFFPTVHTAEGQWLVDGGVAANNPTMCAYAEARRIWPEDEIKVVSVGTGNQIRAINGRKSQKWGGLEWLGHGLMDILFDGPMSAVDYQCEWILGEERYIRVNGELRGCDDDMDNVSEGNINNLKRLGEAWYGKFGNKIIKMLSQ